MECREFLSGPQNYLPNYFRPSESEATFNFPPREEPLFQDGQTPSEVNFFDFPVLDLVPPPSFGFEQSSIEKIREQSPILASNYSPACGQELEPIHKNVQNITKRQDGFLSFSAQRTFSIKAAFIDFLPYADKMLILCVNGEHRYYLKYTGNETSSSISYQYMPKDLVAHNGELLVIASPNILTFKDLDRGKILSTVFLKSAPTAVTNISKDWAISLKDRSVLILDPTGTLLKHIISTESKRNISQLISSESYLISIYSDRRCHFYKKEENYDQMHSISLGHYFVSFPTAVSIHESTVFFGDKKGRLCIFDLTKKMFVFSDKIPEDVPIIDIVPYSHGVFVATPTSILFFKKIENSYFVDKSPIHPPADIGCISFMKKAGEKILLGGAVNEGLSVIYEFSPVSLTPMPLFPFTPLAFDSPIGLKRKIDQISNSSPLQVEQASFQCEVPAETTGSLNFGYGDVLASQIRQNQVQKKSRILASEVQSTARKRNEFLSFSHICTVSINADLIDCIHRNNKAIILFNKGGPDFVFEYTGKRSSIEIPPPRRNVHQLDDDQRWTCKGEPLIVHECQPDERLAYNGESFAISTPHILTFCKDLGSVEVLSQVQLTTEPTAITSISTDWAISLKDNSILIFDAIGTFVKSIRSKKFISQLKSNESYLIAVTSDKNCYFYKKEENYAKEYSLFSRNYLNSLPSAASIHESTVFFGDTRGGLCFFDLNQRMLISSYKIPEEIPIVGIVPYLDGVLVATKTSIVYFTKKENRYIVDESPLNKPSHIKFISFMKKVGEKILMGGKTGGGLDEIYEFSPIFLPTKAFKQL